MPEQTGRLRPATSRVDLDFNAGEDVEVRVLVLDEQDELVPLSSAVAVIAIPGRCTEHTWSVAAGNLRHGGVGEVFLVCTAEDTTAWYRAFGDSEWQLDVVDIFGRDRRPVEGDVRVNPTRSGGSSC